MTRAPPPGGSRVDLAAVRVHEPARDRQPRPAPPVAVRAPGRLGTAARRRAAGPLRRSRDRRRGPRRACPRRAARRALRAWRSALSSRFVRTRWSVTGSASSRTGAFATTSSRDRPGSTVSAARRAISARSTGSSVWASRAYSARENTNRSPTRRSRCAALSWARARASPSPMPCSIASSEPRRVNSGVRRSWAIAVTGSGVRVGGGGDAERVLERAGHAAQRVADLGDLAGARGRPAHRELAAGDPLRVGGEPRERAQHPAAAAGRRRAEHDGEGGSGRGRARSPSARRHSRGDEQVAVDACDRDVGAPVVGADPLLEVGRLLECRRPGRDQAAAATFDRLELVASARPFGGLDGRDELGLDAESRLSA